MEASTRPLNGCRLGLFGRGGSGKSTCTVLLARALKQAGYAVCVLDADSTNEGLPQALGADRPPAPLLDYFGGTVFSGGRVTCPVDDPMPLEGASVKADRFPQEYVGRTAEGIMVFAAGKMGPLGPGAGCDGPMTKIARDFMVQTEGPAPVTLVDFKAGIEDSSRGVITSLDWVVVVVDPSYASVQMAVAMRKLFEQMHAGHQPATQHLASPELVALARRAFETARTKGVACVLNKVADADTDRVLRQRLAQAGITPVAAIRDEPGLRQAWLQGTQVDSPAARHEMAKIVEALERMTREAFPAPA
ncbi:MAG: P-loop NTPase [Verrucomicrobia bacterium]|nr:P-loop NTPase [Verrucomicrobiota bacterium]